MKIFITRHGETEWNKAKKMQGWNNSNLTEKGIDSAIKLGERLKNIKFDCVYSSPQGRAVDTAMHIIGDRCNRIIMSDDLREMGFGTWEGMDFVKIEELYPEQQFNFHNKPHLYEPVDGESFQELFRRVENVLNEIISNSSVENVLVVTHAVVIKAIFSIIGKHPLDVFWDEPFIHGTCLSILEITDKERNFILEADISHLDL